MALDPAAAPVLVAPVRTPIGKFGGRLAPLTAADPGTGVSDGMGLVLWSSGRRRELCSGGPIQKQPRHGLLDAAAEAASRPRGEEAS